MKFIKTVALAFSLLFLWGCLNAQNAGTTMPVKVLPGSDTSKPLIFYISGDGGWNKFSNSFLTTMNGKGYPVVGLNAKEYFWHKKDAVITARDMNDLLSVNARQMKADKIIMIGYSFGADVMPFFATRISKDIQSKLKYIVLMSPSGETDFEVHVSELLGIRKAGGDSVPAEINKISCPLLMVFGEKENDFPFSKITIKNYRLSLLPGGHHYDGDAVAVCNAILSYIR